jgi:hypothetical protein
MESKLNLQKGAGGKVIFRVVKKMIQFRATECCFRREMENKIKFVDERDENLTFKGAWSSVMSKFSYKTIRLQNSEDKNFKLYIILKYETERDSQSENFTVFAGMMLHSVALCSIVYHAVRLSLS